MKAPYAEISNWMFEAALPWWGTNGIDRQHGGYVEQVTFDGRDAQIDYKRTRVVGRQVYVFSHASMLGWKPGLELAAHGIDFLTSRIWMGQDKGFARRVSRKGEVIDASQDLYDLAFTLFAFGWHMRASGDRDGLRWAHRTLDVVEAKMRHPTGQGFLHEVPAHGWRQQNPHMHLIEAALVVYQASEDDRFAELAREIVQLFQTRFFDIRSRTLAEFFTNDLQRAPDDAGRTIEPGHQFEWAWILMNCQRLLGIDLSEEIRALVDFAELRGVERETGLTFNAIRDDGHPIDRGSRAWPNTERLKAHVARWELDGIDPEVALASSSRLLLDRYLATEVPGLWIDAFDSDGGALSKTVPASTLYHAFLGFSETLRAGKALGRII
jgi:mannose/cellobiose epimerase-like protein (N-acyl-D-glucosamine 2-epimerase family)